MTWNGGTSARPETLSMPVRLMDPVPADGRPHPNPSVLRGPSSEEVIEQRGDPRPEHVGIGGTVKADHVRRPRPPSTPVDRGGTELAAEVRRTDPAVRQAWEQPDQCRGEVA